MTTFKILKLLITISLVLTFSQTAYSWDGNREGFSLMLSAGRSQLALERDGEESSKIAINISGKLGYGMSKDLIFFYYENSNLFTYRYKKVVTKSAGVGFSYYFSNDSPSSYLTFGGGIFAGAAQDSYKITLMDLGSGSSWFVGWGYEFIPHLSIEISYLMGFINDKGNYPDLPDKESALSLTLNLMGY